MKAKRLVLIRVNLKQDNTIIPSAHAFYAKVEVECIGSSLVITDKIVKIATQNIKVSSQ